MTNIIPFPIERRQKLIDDEEVLYNVCVDEAETITQCIVDEIDGIILGLPEIDQNMFDDFDFRNIENPEAKDMYVIANLVNSMFLRYLGIKHNLHSEMDKLHVRITEMQKRNNDTT